MGADGSSGKVADISACTRRAVHLGAALLAVGLGVLALAPLQPARAHEVKDATGKTIEIKDASRIASIGGAITEILFALGAGDRVAAVDQTSFYPAAARALPNVGYARALSPEGVLSSAPTLIIAMEGSGPRETMQVLSQSSVPLVIVPEGHDAAGVVRKIEVVAQAVGMPEKGAELAKAVKADFDLLAREVAALKDRPKAVFVLSAGSGSPLVGGSHSSADAMFTLAGLQNAVPGVTGYKATGDEVLLNAEPEAVVVMSGGGQALPADLIFGLPGFKLSPAAKDRRLVTLPGSYLLGFGPRTPQAARDLAILARGGKADIPELPAHPWSKERDQ
ncbi:hemin ABC transporter substrate-binding protein [Xanthobacteraceae bacterium A53D]